MNFRIGFGYDVHELADGDRLILGGVAIPSTKVSVGHSDADVLIHAICDALLGAAGLRDIGNQFPNTDPVYKGADSKVLLHRVIEMISGKGFSVGNIDCTVVLERPRVNPFVNMMREEIASILRVATEDVSIKATTSETLGFVGREEGICAYAVALIKTTG